MKGILARISSLEIVRVLSIPPFLNFTLSVIFSQMAINMMNIVLIFLIFYLTKSNFSVSILVMTLLVPQVVLSFVGGILADMKNRRKILYISNALRAVVILPLFFNPESTMLVYLVALLVSIISQFYVPAETPLIPNLVKKKQLIAANSIFGICLFGSILLGYVLGGPSIQYLGRPGVFLLISALFGLAAVFTFLIPVKASKPEHTHTGEVTTEIKRSLSEEIRSVFALLRYTSEAGNAFFLIIFSQVVIWVLATIVPGYAQQILQVPAEDLSLFLFAPAGLGLIISSFLLGSKFVKVPRPRLINTGIFITSLALIFFPAITIIASSPMTQTINSYLPHFLQINSILLVLLVAFGAGYGNALISVPSQTTIQTVVPETLRSKIYGLLFAFIGAVSLIPIILAGGIADIFGVGTVLIIMGGLICLVGLIRIRPRAKKPKRKKQR